LVRFISENVHSMILHDSAGRYNTRAACP